MNLHPYLALFALAGFVLLMALTAGIALWDDHKRRIGRGDRGQSARESRA